MMATQVVPDVSVVTGTNLPMLIETLFTRNSDGTATLDSLTAGAVESGQAGVATRALGTSAVDDEDEDE